MSAESPDLTDVKVSVAMITYNHEAFIVQAIESVLMQQTDFAVELVIGEDCSTDGTRAIVRAYGEHYPERVRLLLPEHNLGAASNSVAVLTACRGQYVALLEGDDYWTDPRKLQKQVDFLDLHSDCVICCHDVLTIYEDDKNPSHRLCPPDQREYATLGEFLSGYTVPALSTMFRNHLVASFPVWFFEAPVGDVPLHVLNLLSQEGSVIGYINEVMGVYRVHSGGVWSSRATFERAASHVELFDLLTHVLPERYQKLARARSDLLCQTLGQIMANAALEYDVTSDPLSPVNSMLNSLVQKAHLSRRSLHQTRREFYSQLTFHGDTSNRRLMRLAIGRALFYNPSLLRNLGVWSRAVEVYGTEAVARWMRARAKAVNRASLHRFCNMQV